MILGRISFQANDKMDVFYVAQVQEDGIELADEALLNIEDPQFESDKMWVSGNVPKMKPLSIDGDTAVISAWFKAEAFDKPFVARVYVECELAEELEGVMEYDDESEESNGGNDDLEPQEIHL